MLKLEEGFTVIEAMISVLLLTIALIGTISLQTTFGSSASDRTLHNCLMDVASSALSQCQAGVTPGSTGSCPEGGIAPSLSFSGSCSPSVNTCNSITAAASARGKTFRLTSAVCNLQ
ncbi:MAG: hypothetical protein U0411_01065 [Thermodesulfovibrionales bacterium]